MAEWSRAATLRLESPAPARASFDPAVVPAPLPTNPLAAPRCDDVTVVAVSESADTDWSRATVRAPGERRGRARRFRSWVGRERVVYVGSHPHTGRPTVWLTSGPGLCRVELFGAPSAPTASSRPPIRAERRSAGHGVDEHVAEIRTVLARIRRISDTEVHVERSAVDDVLANPARLLGSVRVDPSPRPGIGLRRVSAGSVPHALGLRSGDRLVGVNGRELRGLEDAMAAYALLQKAEAWHFEVSRNGRTRPLRVEIH